MDVQAPVERPSARDRARGLLRSLLTESQWDDYVKYRSFREEFSFVPSPGCVKKLNEHFGARLDDPTVVCCVFIEFGHRGDPSYGRGLIHLGCRSLGCRSFNGGSGPDTHPRFINTYLPDCWSIEDHLISLLLLMRLDPNFVYLRGCMTRVESYAIRENIRGRRYHLGHS